MFPCAVVGKDGRKLKREDGVVLLRSIFCRWLHQVSSTACVASCWWACIHWTVSFRSMPPRSWSVSLVSQAPTAFSWCNQTQWSVWGRCFAATVSWALHPVESDPCRQYGVSAGRHSGFHQSEYSWEIAFPSRWECPPVFHHLMLQGLRAALASVGSPRRLQCRSRQCRLQSIVIHNHLPAPTSALYSLSFGRHFCSRLCQSYKNCSKSLMSSDTLGCRWIIC